MSAAPTDPHASLAVDHPSSIARGDPGLPGSDADSSSHSQDSSIFSEGPHTPKDEGTADRTDKVAIASATDALTTSHEPEQKGELVGPKEEDEEEDDDDDDGFIPRGLPARPTGAGAAGGPKPVRAR